MEPSFKPFLNLFTERLSLTELQDADFEEIFLLRSNPEVYKFINRDPSREAALGFMKRVKEANSTRKSYYWVIRYKEQQRLLGTICLWNFSEDRLIAEIGYELLPTYHGNGVMNEALQIVVDFGFQHLELKRIEAYTNFENERSIHLLKKNNFILNPDKKDADVPGNLVFEKEVFS